MGGDRTAGAVRRRDLRVVAGRSGAVVLGGPRPGERRRPADQRPVPGADARAVHRADHQGPWPHLASPDGRHPPRPGVGELAPARTRGAAKRPLMSETRLWTGMNEVTKSGKTRIFSAW